MMPNDIRIRSANTALLNREGWREVSKPLNYLEFVNDHDDDDDDVVSRFNMLVITIFYRLQQYNGTIHATMKLLSKCFVLKSTHISRLFTEVPVSYLEEFRYRTPVTVLANYTIYLRRTTVFSGSCSYNAKSKAAILYMIT